MTVSVQPDPTGNVEVPWHRGPLASYDCETSGINVDTDRDGVVTLRGTVSSSADRARAVDIARRTDGVRKVVDSLNVRAPVERR